jgi:4'-phosphopantetheinyl transferase
VLRHEERERSASYLRPQDGARFAASRAVTRVIMSGYLGCEPGRLRFVASGRGQPQLAGHSLQVSLSRSGGVALLAVSPDPVGADLEMVRPRAGLADLVAARFAAAEAVCVASGCAGSPTRSFYRHWVAKEAYLKATGRGLAALRDTELVCGPAPVIGFRGTPEPGWKVCVTEASPGYLAAVVAARPVTAWRRAGPWMPDQRG